MSDVRSNGVLHFDDNEGKMRVQFGDAPEFEIDAMGVHNEWYAVDATFRDENGKIIKERQPEFGLAPWHFVRTLMDRAMQSMTNAQDKAKMKAAADNLSLANANKFLHMVSQEVKRLLSFFDKSSPAEPSSRVSSDNVVYSP